MGHGRRTSQPRRAPPLPGVQMWLLALVSRSEPTLFRSVWVSLCCWWMYVGWRSSCSCLERSRLTKGTFVLADPYLSTSINSLLLLRGTQVNPHFTLQTHTLKHGKQHGARAQWCTYVYHINACMFADVWAHTRTLVISKDV